MSTEVLSEPPSGPPSRWKRWIIRSWVPLTLVLASLAMGGVVTANHTKVLSPIDEWVYADALYKFPTHDVVRLGEKIGPEALNLIACYGVKPWGTSGPKCGSDYSDLSKFPQSGITSASGYTPAYFAVTWVVGEAVHFVTGIDELAAWRFTGTFWLIAAMVLFSAFCRQLRIAPLLTVALGIAYISSPFAWWTYTYISTDAPSAVFGMLMLIAAHKFLNAHWSPWWLVVIGVVAVVFKVTNILAVSFAALYLLVAWLIRVFETRRQVPSGDLTDPRERLSVRVPIYAALAVAGAGLTQVAWIAVQKLPFMIAGPQAVQGGLDRTATSGGVLGQLTNFLPNTILWNPTREEGSVLDVIDQPLSWICVAGVLAAFWGIRQTSQHRALIITTTIASVLFAPLLLAALMIGGSYFDLPARYGAPIVLAFFLMAGLTIRNRWAVWTVLVYALALLGYVLIKAPFYAP